MLLLLLSSGKEVRCSSQEFPDEKKGRRRREGPILAELANFSFRLVGVCLILFKAQLPIWNGVGWGPPPRKDPHTQYPQTHFLRMFVLGTLLTLRFGGQVGALNSARTCGPRTECLHRDLSRTLETNPF